MTVTIPTKKDISPPEKLRENAPCRRRSNSWRPRTSGPQQASPRHGHRAIGPGAPALPSSGSRGIVQPPASRSISLHTAPRTSPPRTAADPPSIRQAVALLNPAFGAPSAGRSFFRWIM